MNIITKEEAIKNGSKWYFTGKSCKNNHIDKRYVNTDICYECKRIQNKSCNKRNPESLKLRARRSYLKKDKNLLNIKSKQWYVNNKDRAKDIKNSWKKRNKVKYKEYLHEYNKRKRKDPIIRLSKNISKSIWNCLKNNKAYISWIKFVDFTLDELKTHLESKFDANMTWENYGQYWHIDHIKPLSWFDLNKEFKDAWSLNNLQPLEASKNLSKCNRYEG